MDTLDLATIQQLYTFGVIGVAVTLFTFDRVPLEVSAFSVVAALIVFFYFAPLRGARGENLLGIEELVSGFADPVLFAIMALLVIGQGLYQTGAIERPAKMIARVGRYGAAMAMMTSLLAAAIFSGFLNNTPVVVIFIPILTAVAASIGKTTERVLMPLSFICILGGMTTLIGSSSNLIVGAIAAKSGMSEIGFFDFTVPGALLAGVGALYVVFVLPRLLPGRGAGGERAHKPSGRLYVTDVTLSDGHPWIGLHSEAGLFPALREMTVRLIKRDGQTILRPFDDVTMRQGDVVSVAATRRVLTDALAHPAQALTRENAPRQGSRSDTGPVPGRQTAEMAEAVVAPGSRLLGLTLAQAQHRLGAEARLVALQRHGRMMRKALADIHLEEGDIVLALARPEVLKALRGNRDLFVLEWSASDVPRTHHAWRAVTIFALTVGAASLGVVPISLAAIVGALAMLVFGCLNPRQAARAFDRRIYLLIGAALALAEALQATGGAQLLADMVVRTFAVHGPAVLLSALFLLTAVLTNFLSNQATGALMTPVTVKTAISAGLPPEPFVYGLIFALNCSFATPIAYQTNMIVMGPGQYRFRDFLIGGTPLILLIWLAYSVFAPLYFEL